LPLAGGGGEAAGGVTGVINGLAGLVECKTKDKRTEASRAEELTKEVNNSCLSYQTKVRGDSPSL